MRTPSPDAVEDEEQLDEDAAERQDAAHEGAGEWVGQPVLVGDLTGDLIGPHRLLDSLQKYKVATLIRVHLVGTLINAHHLCNSIGRFSM